MFILDLQNNYRTEGRVRKTFEDAHRQTPMYDMQYGLQESKYACGAYEVTQDRETIWTGIV